MKRTLVAALTLGLMGLSTGMAHAAEPYREVAHRGLTSHAVENTLQAMTDAIRAKYFGVEFDVRLTKDKRAVVLHDSTMNRTTACSGAIKDVTLAVAEDCGLFSLETMTKHIDSKSKKYKWGGSVYVHVKVTLSDGTAAGLVNRAKSITGYKTRVVFMLEDEKNAPRLAKTWTGRQGLMIHTANDWKLATDPKGPFKVGVTYDNGTPGYDAVITTARAAAMAKLKRELWAIEGAPQSAKELAGLKITGLFV